MTTLLSPLHTISPIDGRYYEKCRILSQYFSEYAFIFYRLKVEIYWFQSLTMLPEFQKIISIDEQEKHFLNKIIEDFTEADAEKIKHFERQTNHDVKAIEYFLIEKFQQSETLKQASSFIHFAATSEDINNVAYALMLKEAITEVMQPQQQQLLQQITALAKQYGHYPMMARTHGQPASPTTLGKELINFSARLARPLQQLEELRIPAKFNGAVGNYNAHRIAFPNIDWPKHCTQFIQSLGLVFNPYSTQIESHDGIAELSHLMIRFNNILLDYSRDIWTYISLNYFKQKIIGNEVGSSTMPHKVNPIDFENAEGNLGLANALFEHFANKLSQSRLQRDLSDSTVLRNLGTAFSYALLAYQSLAKGNHKLEVNEQRLKEDLQDHWEILAEAIQVVMRSQQIPNAYEQLKQFSRGQEITQESLQQFILSLPLKAEVRKQLLKLTPEMYTGFAAELVKTFS